MARSRKGVYSVFALGTLLACLEVVARCVDHQIARRAIEELNSTINRRTLPVTFYAASPGLVDEVEGTSPFFDS